jgi:hypothetical protein
MDTERLNTILRELIELDPSLRSEEAQLRAYLVKLEEVKPHIILDETFVKNLRSTVVRTPKRIRSPYMNVGWWAVRLVPLGAVALLVFTLMPAAPTPYIEESVSLPTQADDARILEVEMGGVPSTPSADMYGFGGGAADETTAQPEMMNQKTMMAPSPSTAFIVEPQAPGVRIRINSITTEESGFVVVYGNEEIIGVSPLMEIGTTENLPINLRMRTVAGGFYRAVFHRDNGDRVFAQGSDLPAFDQFGNPIETALVITAAN